MLRGEYLNGYASSSLKNIFMLSFSSSSQIDAKVQGEKRTFQIVLFNLCRPRVAPSYILRIRITTRKNSNTNTITQITHVQKFRMIRCVFQQTQNYMILYSHKQASKYVTVYAIGHILTFIL